jgi:hypothetical protein
MIIQLLTQLMVHEINMQAVSGSHTFMHSFTVWMCAAFHYKVLHSRVSAFIV